ncbi:MAG: aminomethyl-transferring glycine dehydrogenase subunit GcvPB [Spirochaetales bacterium]|nr:aminomethyl-transferring glycine dehydrogenase subunit GcvPB [Spirochaetales bacterium]
MNEPAASRPKDSFPLLFELSRRGRRGYCFPPLDVPEQPAEALLPARFLREEGPELPELSELQVVRHYTNLSRRNYGVDLGFYPLGSCTMKYNPKLSEAAAADTGFARLHPLQPQASAQGILELMHDLLSRLSVVTGMRWGTLQPFAGAHGEFTGMKLFKACFEDRGEAQRTRVLVPDSAHGTNPASAHLAGFEVVEVHSDRRGLVSLEAIKPHLDERLAGIMMTNPNTLGLFETDILPIAEAVHQAGGLLYYDGANLNAIVGKVRPGDMGFDVVHLNLHKTFATPHGGGGPGSGPVLVGDTLLPYLPVPDVVRGEDGAFGLASNRPRSIGRLSGFYGNVAVMVRAYAYLLSMGADGLRRAAELAVLNANYLKERLKELYDLPYDSLCKHEFVLSARGLKEQNGVGALDVAKRLLDFGVHPPTVYFPLIVPEALMIEPTETESLETLDHFVEVMSRIHREAGDSPDRLRQAPTVTPVERIDEVLAAKHPVVRWRPEPAEEGGGAGAARGPQS